MVDFTRLSVADGLEAALEAATHLEPKHAATVAAARALARKIDAWDVIVEWALEDAAETESRPKVPPNDNTSLGTYSKYLDQLGLTVPAVKVGASIPKPAPEPAPKPTGSGASISSLQDRVAQRQAR